MLLVILNLSNKREPPRHKAEASQTLPMFLRSREREPPRHKAVASAKPS